MNLLDMRTVLLSYVISNAICASVLASLWWQNRRRSPELGLWLAVCKIMAEANGGRIEVQSEPGVGSTFTLYLPVQQVANG